MRNNITLSGDFSCHVDPSSGSICFEMRLSKLSVNISCDHNVHLSVDATQLLCLLSNN